jgi:hypothetical protein
MDIEEVLEDKDLLGRAVAIASNRAHETEPVDGVWYVDEFFSVMEKKGGNSFLMLHQDEGTRREVRRRDEGITGLGYWSKR